MIRTYQLMENKSLSIIIPAYNEAESLKVFMPKILEFCSENNFELIIVDDGSKDDTKQVCMEYQGQSNFTLISYRVNKGYGGAIKTGVREAKTDYLITIDADGQHNFEDVLILFNKIKETDADMIVGSRNKKDDASLYRSFGKSVIRTIAKIALPMDIYDINSGMKIYNAELAKKYIKLCPDNMAYSETILMVFVNFKHFVIEHPITINQRISGKSTIGTITALETIQEIINIIILFNPLKFFIPASIVVLLVSIGWGIPIILRDDGVSVGTMLGILTSFLIFSIGLLAEQISRIRKTII